MRSPRDLFKASVGLALLLAACGGGAAAPSSAPASSPAPASVAAPKPSAAASTSASAKPAASAAASAKPAASAAGSAAAKPSASVAPTATTLPAVAGDEAQVTPTKFEIPPVAGKVASMDIMEISQANHMLYLADRTSGGVDVIDVSSATPKYVTTVKTSDTPNGITVADNVNKVFTGLTNSKVAIIDIDPKSPNVNKVITELDTGGKKRADESDYDPNTKKGMVANSDDQFVTTIDMVNNKISKRIDVPGGSIEQPRYNPADKFMYLTGSEDNVYYQFDMTNDTLVKKTAIDDKCTPNGNAINPTSNIALLGCSIRTQPQHVAIWDIKGGKTTATYANVGGCDGTIYDAKADAFFTGCNNYFRGPQLGILNGKDGKWIINVAVKSSGAAAYDETNKIVYDRDAVEGALLYFPLPNLTSIAASSKPVSASAAAAAGGASAKPAASGAAAAGGSAAAKPSAS
jgi:hypothetical protein